MSKLQLAKRVLVLITCLAFLLKMLFHGNGGMEFTLHVGNWFLCSAKSTTEELSAKYSYSGLALLAACLTAQAATRIFFFFREARKKRG
jgi:hypothetical protein